VLYLTHVYSIFKHHQHPGEHDNYVKGGSSVPCLKVANDIVFVMMCHSENVGMCSIRMKAHWMCNTGNRLCIYQQFAFKGDEGETVT